MRKILLRVFLAFAFLILTKKVFAQSVFPPVSYPQGYFRNPLNIPIQLAANFGELRPNHFHMGFDIRTNQRENLPVFAAAGGYVSRIKIEQYGFGRAIYITHPNGFTTVYAHLNVFYNALESYVKQQQYATRHWEQELTFPANLFPVVKGQQIAYSGNTGGSQGPHLHFEIRDTKTENNLNPWLFGFGLSDKIPPIISRLYYYDRRYSTYQTKPIAIPLTGGNGNYSSKSKTILLPTPYVSFGITTDDKRNASSYKYGIYEAALTVDDSLESAFRLNDISYDDTRYVNGSIDYATKLAGGNYIQHLSRLPGNNSTIFSYGRNGSIYISDTMVHVAQIRVSDANGNTSILNFKFRRSAFWPKGRVVAANSLLMIPQRENRVTSEELEADFSAMAFYDTVPLVLRSVAARAPGLVSAVHYLHNYTVPVHDSFTVRIRPSAALAQNLKDRVVMQLVSNHKTEAVKGVWINGWMQAKFRDLGMLRLLADTILPRIRLVGWTNGSNLRNRKSITLEIKDNAGELKSFNAFANGQWLLFSRKDDYFIHVFDEWILPGTHELTIKAEDAAGNIAEKTFRFTR